MSDRTELEELRRLDELERKAAAASPAPQQPQPAYQQQTLKQTMREQSAASPWDAFNTGIANASTRIAQGVGQLLPQGSPLGRFLLGNTTQRDVDLLEAGTEGNPYARTGQVAMDITASAPAALKLFKAVNAARGLAPAIAAETGLNAGYGALTSDPGKRAEGAAWGAGGTLAGHSVLPLAKAAGSGVANVLGGTTGAGTEAVKQAFKGGDEFVANMRGKVEPSLVVERARAGIHTMRQDMQEAYKQNRQVWAAGQTPLDLTDVADTYIKLTGSLGHDGFSKIGPAERRVLEEANEVLTDFASNPRWHTTEGFDALKQRLQAIYPESPQMRQAQRAISTMADSVKQTIVKQNPEYASAMQDYWQRSAQLNEIERSLSLGEKATTDTALRKLQSLMRNNANTNYGQRLVSADALAQQGGQDVRPALAGQAMNDWLPRGIARGVGATVLPAGVFSGGMGVPAAAATAAVQSPRLVGETANIAGNIWDKMRIETMINALRHGVGPAVAGKRDNERE